MVTTEPTAEEWDELETLSEEQDEQIRAMCVSASLMRHGLCDYIRAMLAPMGSEEQQRHLVNGRAMLSEAGKVLA